MIFPTKTVARSALYQHLAAHLCKVPVLHKMPATKTPVPEKWDASKLPSLSGKTAIITGANSGIGYITALELAKKGAHVVLACRNQNRALDAMARLEAEVRVHRGKGTFEFIQLDTSSLASVDAFAKAFLQKHSHLHMLINNAGIMAVPHALSADGVESQLATNHLGHFALTSRLMGALKASAPSRIVNVSSLAHHYAKFDENTITTDEQNYNPWTVYSNSKLCNLLFTFELDRRLKAAGIDGVKVVACHPGITATNLFAAPSTDNPWYWRFAFKLYQAVPIMQNSEMGALPSLYAAAAPGVASGDYFGPSGFQAAWGYPTHEEPKNKSRSTSAAKALWEFSERVAKVNFEV